MYAIDSAMMRPITTIMGMIALSSNVGGPKKNGCTKATTSPSPTPEKSASPMGIATLGPTTTATMTEIRLRNPRANRLSTMMMSSTPPASGLCVHRDGSRAGVSSYPVSADRHARRLRAHEHLRQHGEHGVDVLLRRGPAQGEAQGGAGLTL